MLEIKNSYKRKESMERRKEKEDKMSSVLTGAALLAAAASMIPEVNRTPVMALTLKGERFNYSPGAYHATLHTHPS